MNTKNPNGISNLGVILTDSAYVYAVYTVNTIQFWVEMQGFVVTVKIGLLSCLYRIKNRFLILFSKMVVWKIVRFRAKLSNGIIESLVCERHFLFLNIFPCLRFS
jgi:hypothetical protein